MSGSSDEISISELPGRMQDINADDVGAACLALKFVYENCMGYFGATLGDCPSREWLEASLWQAMGRLDRLFMALMQPGQPQVVVLSKPL